MSEFLNNLDDGWTIYLWLIFGAMIIIAAVWAIRWAARNEQFDEDIKYVVFDQDDKDKMSPEEFEKAMKVNEAQEKRREELQRERMEQNGG